MKNSKESQKTVQDKITIKSFQSFNVIPNKLTIINHPKNLQRFSIVKGSGNFSVSLSDKNLANVNYDGQNQIFTLKPLKLGNLKVIITDLNIPNSEE